VIEAHSGTLSLGAGLLKEQIMKRLEHKEIQQEAFKVLVHVAELCELHQLDYVLMYGTLLGAVRHKGFIPWDDDVDIAMPRQHYEKLRVLLAHNQEKFRFLDRSTTKDYPYLIGRVSSKNTKIVRTDELDCGMGVFIDIYPIDDIDNNYHKAVFWAKILGVLSSLYFASTRTALEPYCRNRTIKKIYVIGARLIGAEMIEQLINKIVMKSNGGLSCAYVGVAFWMTFQSRRNVLPLRYFQEFTKLEFNGQMFNAPRDYHELLCNYYGDYMTLPPPAEQKPHHQYEAFYA
jgi:lipopolysaccharide cholinephosphotransferase